MTPDLQRNKLAAYKELNRYSDAVRLLDEMIAADSLNTHLYIERANCYLMQSACPAGTIETASSFPSVSFSRPLRTGTADCFRVEPVRATE